MEAPTDATTILEPEIEAPTVATKSFWDVANLCPAASSSDNPPLKKGDIDATRKESERKSIKSVDFSIVTIAFFLFLSILVGMALLVFRAS